MGPDVIREACGPDLHLDTRTAEARPTSSPVTTATVTEYARTRPSNRKSNRTGRSPGRRIVASARATHVPRRTPAASAKHGEHQTLGHHLSNEAAAPGAERGADRELPVPACCPRQQEVRHVHGGDDHHEDDHREDDRGAERIRSKLIFFGTCKAFRQDSDSKICVRVRILTREALEPRRSSPPEPCRW